jgi:hypothetical protein
MTAWTWRSYHIGRRAPSRGSRAVAWVAAYWLSPPGTPWCAAPALATLDGVIATVPPDSVLGFSLVTLRRDLADLNERLAEQVRGDAG